MHVFLCCFRDCAQILPAQGNQEHDTGQIDGRVMDPRDEGTAGHTHRSDGDNDLLSSAGRRISAWDLLVDLVKEEFMVSKKIS